MWCLVLFVFELCNDLVASLLEVGEFFGALFFAPGGEEVFSFLEIVDFFLCAFDPVFFCFFVVEIGLSRGDFVQVGAGVFDAFFLSSDADFEVCDFESFCAGHLPSVVTCFDFFINGVELLLEIDDGIV